MWRQRLLEHEHEMLVRVERRPDFLDKIIPYMDSLESTMRDLRKEPLGVGCG
jgi:hypothetical protein